MERNKSLEEEKKKNIHDQYFPPDPLNSSTAHTSTTQYPRHRYPCCNHTEQNSCSHHCHHNCGAHNYVQQCPRDTGNTERDSDNTTNIVSNRLDELSKVVTSLNVKFESLADFLTTTTATPDSASSATVPTVSPDTPSSSKEAPPMDISTISLDGFMFGEEGSGINLN